MSNFSDLYAPLRTLLGDTGTVAIYSTTQLDAGIYNGLLADVVDGGGFSEGAAGGGGARTITPGATAYADIYRLCLRAAIALVSPGRGLQRWQTKVLSITRDTGAGSLAFWLESELRRVKDGTFTCDSETEWDVFLRGTADSLAALSSYPS